MRHLCSSSALLRRDVASLTHQAIMGHLRSSLVEGIVRTKFRYAVDFVFEYLALTLLKVPSNYNSNEPYPLIFDFGETLAARHVTI